MALPANIQAVSEESAAMLRRLRLDRGLTQAEVARAAGVPLPVVQRAESGAVPRPRWALKLATFYERRVTEIWEP